MFKNEDVEKAIAEGKLVKATPPQQPTAFPPIPTYPAAINQNFVAPLPAGSWQSPDQQRQWQNPSLPQVRISPLPPSASLTAGAAAASQAIQVVKTTPSSGGSGITSLTLTAPREIVVAGSPTTGSTPEIDLTWATEPASTVFAAPGIGLSGLEAIAVNAVGPTVAGPGTVISVTAAPTTATSWGLFAYYTNAGSSPTPSGWAPIAGSDPIFTKSLTGLTPVTVSETVPATNNGGLSTLAIFSGAMPSVVQNANDGFSFLGPQNKAFPSGNTAGNTLLIVMYSVGDTGGTPPALSASDSNGNTYTPISSLAYGGTITNVHGNNQGLSQQVLIAVNCASGANTVTWSVGGQTGGGRAANLYMYEIGPLAAGPGLPFFRQLNGGDFSGFDASKIISGLVTTSHGGTGSNLSGTGGTSKVLRQSAAGANITVSQLAAADLTDGTTGTGAVVLASGASLTGKFVQYNGISLIGNGVPAEYATVDLTAQAANISAATLYAVPGGGVGLYRVSAYVIETTAGSVSSTLPNVQIIYTDPDTNASVTIDATPVLAGAGLGQTAALTNNAIGTTASGVIVISAKASTNIQYQTVNYASSAAGMQYALHIRLEAI